MRGGLCQRRDGLSLAGSASKRRLTRDQWGDALVPKILSLVCASFLLTTGSAALAQAAPKPVSRADFVKTIDGRFNALDTNHDGKVTKDELAAQQQRELQTAKARIAQQLQAKFKQLDTNKDGQLSLQEFMAAAPAVHSSETPDQILQQFDSNHDGKITADEFRNPEVAKFNKVDANHDGIVTPDEVKAAATRR
jgi:Ca2+-binding EF-hand superfamily protein